MSLLRTAQPRDPQSRRIAGPPPAPSADRGIFPEAAAGEPVGQALDALSHLLDRSGEGAFALVRLLGAGKLLLVQALDLLLCRAHALAQLRNFVGEHDRRRHREPGITDFAEGLAQLLNTQVELAREPHEIILLPVVAGHAVDAAIDGHADLGHGSLASGPRPRARCGSCRPPARAAARPRGWRLPARPNAPGSDRARPRAASGPSRRPATGLRGTPAARRARRADAPPTQARRWPHPAGAARARSAIRRLPRAWPKLSDLMPPPSIRRPAPLTGGLNRYHLPPHERRRAFEAKFRGVNPRPPSRERRESGNEPQDSRPHGERHSRSRHGCGRGGEVRPPWPAHGRGRCR